MVPTWDGELTNIQLIARKASFFNGFVRTYTPFQVEGDKEVVYPEERQKVEQRVDELVVRAANLWTDIFNVTFTKDSANMEAKADVVVGETILVKDAPISWILWADNRIQQVRTFFDTLPTLNEAETWEKDSVSAMWKSNSIKTIKTEKVTVPVIMYQHTDKHPAQVERVQKDVPIGQYEKQNFSSAISSERKRKILEKIDRIIVALKVARANANSLEVEKLSIAKPIFDYILAD
jgi:hypothetical protein